MAGFDVKISVGGSQLAKFGNITISRAVSGVGLSGLCTTELAFDTPAPFSAVRAAEVIVSGIDLPKMYISTRQKSGGTVSVRCFDRMAFADAVFPAEELDAYHDADNLKARKAALNDDLVSRKISTLTYNTQLKAAEQQYSGDVPIGAIMDKIKAAMDNISGYGGIPSWIKSISISKLKGVTCGDILQRISEAACGVWWITNGNELALVRFGDYAGTAAVTQHTPIDEGETYSVGGVRCISGSETYERGTPRHSYDSIVISSDFASDVGCEDIWDKVKNHTQTAVTVNSCKVLYILPIVTAVTFAQNKQTYIINNCSYSVTKNGIYAQLIGNGADGDEIGTRGALTRSIDSKLTANAKSGNVIHTAYQGDIYTD